MHKPLVFFVGQTFGRWESGPVVCQADNDALQYYRKPTQSRLRKTPSTTNHHPAKTHAKTTAQNHQLPKSRGARLLLHPYIYTHIYIYLICQGNNDSDGRSGLVPRCPTCLDAQALCRGVRHAQAWSAFDNMVLALVNPSHAWAGFSSCGKPWPDLAGAGQAWPCLAGLASSGKARPCMARPGWSWPHLPGPGQSLRTHILYEHWLVSLFAD